MSMLDDILMNDKLTAENKRLLKRHDLMADMVTRIRSSPFIVGNFFLDDGVTPRKTIMICPMEGSDALYDYTLKGDE